MEPSRSSWRRAAAGTALVCSLSVVVACGSSTSATPATTASPTTAAGSSATTAPAAASTVPAASGNSKGAFCVDAKQLADFDTQQLKDIKGSVNVVDPAYVSKSFGDTTALLNTLHSDAPAGISAVATEYFTAYVEYARVVASVNFVLQPTDPTARKAVVDATKAYGPVALKDLPQLDTFVKTTCGFGLNLATTAP